MKRRKPPRVDPTELRGDADRGELVREVLEVRARREREARERAALERQRGAGGASWWPALLLGLAAAWVWLVPPAALRPPAAPPQPVEAEEAALRLTLYLEAQRIEAGRRATGALPAELPQSAVSPAITYTRLGPGLYQLTGIAPGLVLTYRSDLPAAELLGAGAGLVEGVP